MLGETKTGLIGASVARAAGQPVSRVTPIGSLNQSVEKVRGCVSRLETLAEQMVGPAPPEPESTPKSVYSDGMLGEVYMCADAIDTLVDRAHRAMSRIQDVL